ncbi:MAG: AAA family ATPase [Pirellulales bacterium]
MVTTAVPETPNLLATILSEDVFHPAEPGSLEDAGISDSLVDSLVSKYLSVVGTASGRGIADHICLPYGVIEGVLARLRTRQFMAHTGSAPLNDYYYALTDQGRQRAQGFMEVCSYVGPAPVPLIEYVLSVEAQAVRAEAPKRAQLEQAFEDITTDPGVFDSLGPAVNSGAGLFLYGAPGNGKTTLAERITRCFGQHVWIPRTLIEDGQLIKLYDPAYHEALKSSEQTFLKQNGHDRRWIKVRRPTVVAGGELTMDSLEIRHDHHSNVSEAPLQLKSNCGSLLIDDFGRQRMEPQELLNRWIVPLEKRYDFLTLASGKKIQVPFEQLIIFSTNLEPKDLVDEAFLRRIPYKVNIADPGEEEFHRLFERCAPNLGCEYRRETVEYLLATHYRPIGRRLRRCHPRDLLSQIRAYAAYNDLPFEMRPDYFDRVVKSYFTQVLDTPQEYRPAITQPGSN